MTQVLYDQLWHYSECFTRDPLQRSELLTMAWKEGERLGKRSTPGLMRSMMHFRSKELNKRSAFSAKEVGKRTLDAWNHDKVYLERPAVKGEEGSTLAELLLFNKTTPLDFCITNDFLSSLNEKESAVLEALIAGYKQNEVCKRQHISYPQFQSLRKTLQDRTVDYL